MTNPKPTARAYSASSPIANSTSPMDFGDKCFLCSRVINIDTPPVDSREFWISKNGGMFLCHSDCIALMNQRGGTPADFHRGPIPKDPAPVEEVTPPTQEQGPGWLHFEKLTDYNAYVRKTSIPETTKVTVGSQLLQAGE